MRLKTLQSTALSENRKRLNFLKLIIEIHT